MTIDRNAMLTRVISELPALTESGSAPLPTTLNGNHRLIASAVRRQLALDLQAAGKFKISAGPGEQDPGDYVRAAVGLHTLQGIALVGSDVFNMSIDKAILRVGQAELEETGPFTILRHGHTPALLMPGAMFVVGAKIPDFGTPTQVFHDSGEQRRYTMLAIAAAKALEEIVDGLVTE